MKQYILSIAMLGLALLALPGVVRANEGVANLRGGGTSGACFATSVYIDNTYKILATCRDLKIALTPEENRYILWSEDENGKQRRLGEIVAGKFYGQVDTKFVKLFVTVESSPYVNKPSDNVVLTGMMQAIDFGPGVAPEQAIVTPTPTQTVETAVTVAPTASSTSQQGSGLAGVFGTIFKIVLLGFGALLIVVGVTSFMARRRSL